MSPSEMGDGRAGSGRTFKVWCRADIDSNARSTPFPPFRTTSRLLPNLRDEERRKVGRWMRANKHPPGRDASLPRSSTVVRDWKQSRAAKVPPVVGRSPLSLSWEEKDRKG